MGEKRIKRLRIDIQSIINGGVFLGVKPKIEFLEWVGGQTKQLPDDTRFVFMTVDPIQPSMLYVYLASESWPVVKSYKDIPDVGINIRAHYPEVEGGDDLSKQ